MGVTLQLMLGLVLASSICGNSTDNNTIPQDAALDKIDRNLNLIEKLPKTDTELNNVHRNTQENPSSVKQNISETYLNLPGSKQSESLATNVVEKESFQEIKKENAIKQESNDKNRGDNSRSIDLDIERYVSPEFHNRNNVLSSPVSPDEEKYIDNTFNYKTSETSFVFSTFDLTTPRSNLFDNKFKETMHSVNQKLEHIDFEENMNRNSALHMNKFLEDYKTTPNTSMDYKEITNILKNNTIMKNSEHNDLVVEKNKKVEYEVSFNDTKTYGGKPKGDLEKFETTTPKNNFILTTRKSVTLTKPPTNRNNSHILSNRIETETIKAINLPTTEKPKGEQESRVYVKANEQNVMENQIFPVHVTAPETTEKAARTTSHLSTDTESDKELAGVNEQLTTANAADVMTTTAASKLSSFVVEESTTIGTDTTTATTVANETETDSTTVTNKEETTVTNIIDTTAVTNKEDTTTVTNEVDTTIVTEELTTIKVETTEVISESTGTTLNVGGTTQATALEKITQEQSTAAIETTSASTTIEEATIVSSTVRDTKTSGNVEGTTEIELRTTDNSFRSSKGVIFEETTTADRTTEVTTILNVSPDETSDTTSTRTEDFTTAEVTTAEVPVTTITIEATATDKRDETAVTEANVKFVHVETVDSGHTTLLPETLNPSFNYPTAYNEQPADNKSVEVTTINNTINDGEDGTEPPDAIVDSSGQSKGKIAAIVISSVGAVCLVLLAGLLYIMRKRQKRFNYGQRCRPVNLDDYSMDNISVHSNVRRKGVLRTSKRSYGNPAFDDPMAATHPLNFPALAKFASNVEDIKAEFEEIPQISAKTSELPAGCEPKNRYANVIPLPETRVYLKAIDGYPNSDYINANFVTGPKNIRGYYIACQAPLQNTVDDFWRMVWEQQSKLILMLTHLFENGVEKCVDYLPPSEVLDCNRLFGDFQITLKKREVKDKYIISSLQLKNMVSNSWREVTHFWYLGWPEKGVPTEGNSLIAFLIEARSFMKWTTLDKNNTANGNMQNGATPYEMNPVVVHCSPGTGRTGVAIACDIAIREFEQTRLVDIPKIVYRIRRDRASAVQTKEQYMFIYKVVSLYATKLTGGALDSF